MVRCRQVLPNSRRGCCGAGEVIDHDHSRRGCCWRGRGHWSWSQNRQQQATWIRPWGWGNCRRRKKGQIRLHIHIYILISLCCQVECWFKNSKQNWSSLLSCLMEDYQESSIRSTISKNRTDCKLQNEGTLEEKAARGVNQAQIAKQSHTSKRWTGLGLSATR